MVRRYSKALPLPVIPTFVSVEAGSNPLRTSSAFALIVALYMRVADLMTDSSQRSENRASLPSEVLNFWRSMGSLSCMKEIIGWMFLEYMSKSRLQESTYLSACLESIMSGSRKNLYLPATFLSQATYREDFSRYDKPSLRSSIFFTAIFDTPSIAIWASPSSATESSPYSSKTLS